MKRLIFFVLAAFAFAACEQAPIEEQSAIRQDAPETLTVGFEGDDTRIQLNEAQKTVWTKGDQVSVFYKSYDNLKFEFEGNTGDRNGTLKRVGGQYNGQTMDDVVVVYPYSADYMITLSEGCVNATIPYTQTYLKGSYGVGDNLMIARSSFNQFSLKSVCGWLKIQLTGAGEVIERITFRGNDGEQVAGLVYVDATTAEATLATAKHNSNDTSQLDGTLVLDDSIYTEVTLDCGEGVTLGKEATAFYIALPPQTFTQGFTVEIEDTEGYVMEQSIDKTLIIERNHIQPMAAFEFINPNRPTQPTPASNEIWYTSSDGNVVTPYNTNAFGAKILSNIYNEEAGKGVITFDSDITTIGNNAFQFCTGLTSICLPQSVTSIGFVALQYCSQLTEVTMGDNISFIDACAFNLCPKLSTFNTDLATEDGRCIIINNSLVAFAPYGVTTYQIPDGVISIENNIFDDCSLLEEIILPNTISYIGNFAFDDCISLSEIVLPNSISYIGNSAFRNCTGLNKVVVDNISTWCNIEFDAFYDDSQYYTGTNPLDYADLYADGHKISELHVPDDITEVKPYSFINYDTLTRVYLHENIQKIGYAAFNGCHNLSTINCFGSHIIIGSKYMFSKNLTNMLIYVPASDDDSIINAYKAAEFWSDYEEYIVEMGETRPASNQIWYTSYDGDVVMPYNTNAFGANIISNEYNNGMGVITFDGDVTMIGNEAFDECDRLTSVNIPDSVTKIGTWAFYNCSSLTSVNIPDSVTKIGYDAFKYCYSLTSVTIGDSVTTIGDGAFQNCTRLTSVNIPDSVTTIGSSAFSYCDSLTSVNIPDSVTTIGNYTFSDCSSLTSVNIPDSVMTIGNYAFYSCKILTSVYCKATTPPSLGNTMVFDSTGSDRKIYVPNASVEAYKSAINWSKYASAIVGYDFDNGVVVE